MGAVEKEAEGGQMTSSPPQTRIIGDTLPAAIDVEDEKLIALQFEGGEDHKL
jgi:hypothetical protein